MEGIKHKTINVNGLNIHIAEKGEGPLVLFLHGFPELWYSWRHQIVYMADHGYRAVAPDLRGYGQTTGAPIDDHTKFTIPHVVGDLIGLLDAITIEGEKVFVVGHDWGAFIAWNLCLFRPDRVNALVSLSVAFIPWNPNGDMVEMLRREYGDDHYMTRFQEEDIKYFASQYEKAGITGRINYYRALHLSWELTSAWRGAKVMVPTKLVVGDLDVAYHMPGVRDYMDNGGFKKDVPLLEEVVVMEGVAHFINQEKPDEINKHIIEFIQKF